MDQAALEGLNPSRVYKFPFVGVSMATLVLYDYLTTLDKEVEYAWNKRKHTPGIILFLINRYFVFFPVVCNIIGTTAGLVGPQLAPPACKKAIVAMTWGIMVGTMIVGLILVLRTIALWNRAKFVLAIFCFLTPCATIAAMVIVGQYTTAMTFEPSVVGKMCNMTYAPHNIFITYVIGTFYETVIVILTGIKAYQHLRHSTKDWVTVVYAQGLIFWLIIVVAAASNMVVPLLAPIDYAGLLSTPQYVIHSICVSRVLFALFEQQKVHIQSQKSVVTTSSEAPSSDGGYDFDVLSTVILPPQEQYSIYDDDLDWELRDQGGWPGIPR